jgi:poly(3-hydroxybutyrate) depolymerase
MVAMHPARTAALLALLLLPAGTVTACARPDAPAPATAASAAPPTSAAPSSHPPRPAERPAPGDHDLYLTWDGVERTYSVHAPPGYRPGARLPLVVVLHYRNGDTAVMRGMTRMDAKADREGFLVAYPVGLDGAMNALICCGDADDVGFVRAMVGHLGQAWGVDPKRVYATGISNGADMSFRLAVEMDDVFAAVAPVSGGYVGEHVAEAGYVPRHPVSVVSFVGQYDMHHASMVEGMQVWRRKLGCAPVRAASVDAAKTVRRTTARCRDGSDTVLYDITGMDHRWPGGTSAGLGDPDTAVNAVDVMWAFFAAHPKRG